jgi:4'-phosphopantetheinyl transferase
MELHTISPCEVHVRYCSTDDADEVDVSRALALLSAGERERHGRLRLERDRDEFALAHGLLRTTLSELEDVAPRDWRFEIGAHGKPALAAGVSARPWSFNLSHTRGLVACAVTRQAAVGIDVELVTRTTDWRGIASRYFSPAETAQIDRAPAAEQATRFFELWTLKEAFAKALGVGLARTLDACAFEVADGTVVGCRLLNGADPAAWQFALFAPAPHHRLAVAVSDGSDRRRRIDVRAAAGAER